MTDGAAPGAEAAGPAGPADSPVPPALPEASEASEALEAPAVGQRKRPGFLAGDAWLIADAAILVPLMLFTLLAGPADPDGRHVVTDPAAFEALVVLGEAFMLLLYVGLPLAWLATTRVGGLRGAWVYLRMAPATRRPWPFHLAVALLAVPAAVALAYGYGAFLAALEAPAGDPFFETLAANVGWPTLAMVALVAGVGEEVLFRGILQRYVGVAGQAVLFTLLHVNQGLIVLPFIAAVALILGYAVKRGAPLWAVMVTHALYDLVLLGMVKLGVGA